MLVMRTVGRSHIKKLPLLKSSVVEDGSSSEQICRLLFFCLLYTATHTSFSFPVKQ